MEHGQTDALSGVVHAERARATDQASKARNRRFLEHQAESMF
jgi:hypothetical protein